MVSRVLSGVRPPEFPRYKLNKLARPACYDCQSEGKNGLKWCNTSSLTSGGQIKTRPGVQQCQAQGLVFCP